MACSSELETCTSAGERERKRKRKSAPLALRSGMPSLPRKQSRRPSRKTRHGGAEPHHFMPWRRKGGFPQDRELKEIAPAPFGTGSASRLLRDCVMTRMRGGRGSRLVVFCLLGSF